MSRTYRDIGGVMSYVDVRDAIPEWAADYAVGDEIGFQNPQTHELELAPIAGFSSRDEYRGRPVIVRPNHLTHLYPDTRILVITEEYHVSRHVVEQHTTDEAVAAARERRG